MVDESHERQEEAPVVLAYDHDDARQDRGAVWLMPAYLGGLVVAEVVYVFVVPMDMTISERYIYESLGDGILNAVLTTVMGLFWGAIGLGLGLWVKKTMIRYVRFGRPARAAAWGFAAGLFPWSIVRAYLGGSDAVLAWLPGEVAWNLIFAMVAAGFLCRRSHVRG